MEKKMKRASDGFDQSHVIGDEAKAKFKYQTLLKEYLELQKEFVSRKRKLQAAKQKRETALAEVRFLRRKRNYLSKSQASNIEELHLPNPDIESNTFQREGNQSTSEAAPNTFYLVSSQQLRNKEEVGNVNEKDVRSRKKLKNHVLTGKGPGLKGKGQGLTWTGFKNGIGQGPPLLALESGARIKSAQMVEPTS